MGHPQLSINWGVIKPGHTQDDLDSAVEKFLDLLAFVSGSFAHVPGPRRADPDADGVKLIVHNLEAVLDKIFGVKIVIIPSLLRYQVLL